MKTLILSLSLFALPVPDEPDLRKECQAFLDSLDMMSIARDYPGAVRNLLSLEPERRERGLNTLSATEEVAAVPWLLPFIHDPEQRVRVSAGLAISRIVSAHALRRRDPAIPERVVLLPLGPEEVDLRPLAWIALQWMQHDEPSMQAHGATMVQYLELHQFRGHLQGLLESRHPAVRNHATFALTALDAAKR